MAETTITALGMMSGTSLDGLDLAVCRFTPDGEKWSYTLLEASTLPYGPPWDKRIRRLPEMNAAELTESNAALGRYFGEMALDFIKRHHLKVDLISSHGHTVFHRPDLDYTFQAGSGAHIAAVTGIDVACDFRSKDVALGGQGAPLVPVGDHFLFADYHACLNLGGIANISYIRDGERKAFDICPVNMALNELASRMGMEYDEEGNMARSGSLIPGLLEKMDNLPFYRQSGAKSLGREWYEREFRPLIMEGNAADLARTVCEHIAGQHARSFASLAGDAVILTTGGGAFNTFLIELITGKGNREIHVPAAELVKFKEAIVFAFLGVLCYLDRVNVFNSATGSLRPHVGGAIYRGR